MPDHYSFPHNHSSLNNERTWVRGDGAPPSSDLQRKTPWKYGALNIIFPGLGLLLLDRVAWGTAFILGSLILWLLMSSAAMPEIPLCGPILAIASAQLSLREAKKWNQSQGYD